MNGWIFIDKPKNITSFKVIKILRKILKIKKIGHSGTLDPFATGILAIAIGEATKSIQYFVTNNHGELLPRTDFRKSEEKNRFTDRRGRGSLG